MDKQDKRSVMNALSQLDITEKDALKFIRNLAHNMMYKSPEAFERFCIDCGIFYTSSTFTLLKNKDKSVDEYGIWSEEFIDKCRYHRILFENKGES
jgi:hypothetical protein